MPNKSPKNVCNECWFEKDNGHAQTCSKRLNPLRTNHKPLHVYPENDIKLHDLESNNCECCPEIITAEYDPKRAIYQFYGSPIIIHKAWDKRK